MAKRRKKGKGNAFNWTVVWTLAVVAVLSVAITCSELLDIPGIPTWAELGAAFNPQQKASDGSMPVKVDFFDVGQGDCSLISANGKHILIDAGENDQTDRVVNYLKQKQIKKIDILIGTHPHSDHIGGMDAVINSFEIGEIILPKLTDDQVPTTKTYLDVLSAIADKNVKVRRANPGEVIEIGGGQLEIRGPLGTYTDLNNASVAARFVYDKVSFWIAGDCSKEAEKDLLASGRVEKSTVYKVSHHGSNTASTEVFMNVLDPDYCIISLAADNKYGHPHKEVTSLFKKMGMPVYRTDLNGTVTVATDGAAVEVIVEKGTGQRE